MRLLIILLLSINFTHLASQVVIRDAKWGDSPSTIKLIERAPLIKENSFENNVYQRDEYTLTYSVLVNNRESELSYLFYNSKLSSISYEVKISLSQLPLIHYEFDEIINEFLQKYSGYESIGSIPYLGAKTNWELVDSILNVVSNSSFSSGLWQKKKIQLNFRANNYHIDIKLFVIPKAEFQFSSDDMKPWVCLTIEYQPYLHTTPDF